MTVSANPIKEVLQTLDRIAGLKLREARKRAKLSQKQLGRVIGVTFQQIQRYERGIAPMSLARALRLAHALDITLTEFFDVPMPRNEALAMNDRGDGGQDIR